MPPKQIRAAITASGQSSFLASTEKFPDTHPCVVEAKELLDPNLSSYQVIQNTRKVKCSTYGVRLAEKCAHFSTLPRKYQIEGMKRTTLGKSVVWEQACADGSDSRRLVTFQAPTGKGKESKIFLIQTGMAGLCIEDFKACGVKVGDVEYVFNVTCDIPVINLGNKAASKLIDKSYCDTDYFQLPIQDLNSKSTEVDCFRMYFDHACLLIDQARQHQKVAIIYSAGGVSRSVVLAMAYLIRYGGHTLEQAYKKMFDARPNMHPSPYFLRQLEDFRSELVQQKLIKDTGNISWKCVDKKGDESKFIILPQFLAEPGLINPFLSDWYHRPTHNDLHYRYPWKQGQTLAHLVTVEKDLWIAQHEESSPSELPNDEDATSASCLAGIFSTATLNIQVLWAIANTKK